jgi:hypothetical protein
MPVLSTAWVGRESHVARERLSIIEHRRVTIQHSASRGGQVSFECDQSRHPVSSDFRIVDWFSKVI